MHAAAWETHRICLRSAPTNAPAAAGDVYDRTCRTNFNEPGFCVLNLGSDIDSHTFRRFMVDLKLAMANLHALATGNTLAFVWASRFDQQNSTKPHVDGGPSENFLMLGYEPSSVRSELEISDYSKCAFDLGITPDEFLLKHNPMFQAGYDLLRPYTVAIPCFAEADYQIVCINNSTTAYCERNPAWQGNLHTATVPIPNESQLRVINSMMIASVPAGTGDSISAADVDQFISTTEVRRRGYDKLHLDDKNESRDESPPRSSVRRDD
ncbi:hypothetical protein FYK55_00465 [Roseiconus nitratireducens]|uniref:Uncharacterized protein n=1 Tax=Roseiconus nitratireducens TaxID=2605748 RepID=A0A5M6DHK1_9BACT|nr:hypothetical protein [Roseiconus nitratireducens]KAA5546933.1 hypothetical protein FYK55_00465 [Roseiconus nitratireducens]